MTIDSAETTTPFWLDGNFAPVQEETTATDLEITGSIPPELHGRFFRNGANPLSGESTDWFFGTGMLHGIELAGGKANWYRNRYVQTPLLEMSGALGPMDTFDPENSFANTSVVGHAGKVLALQESHAPTELTTELDTVGRYTFDDKLTSPMTAHPKVCPETGEMLAFGYSFIEEPYLTYLRISADGELVQNEVVDIGRGAMQHDFLVSRNYAIFLDLPMLFDLGRLETGSPIYFDAEAGARIGVMPRTGTGADVRWFDIEPCYVYHTLNAFEVGDELNIYACRMVGYEGIGMENPPSPNLHRWTINLATGDVSESPVDDVAIDFPRLSPDRVGLQNRYGYFGQFDPVVPTIRSYHKYDIETGARATHQLAPGRLGSEAVFVPAADATSEDDGYVMTFVYDSATDTSELAILDASQFAADPIARIHLPVRVPFGFHGTWIAD